MYGTIKMYNEDKGFGFITPHGEYDDIFMHISDVNGNVLPKSFDGSSFEVVDGNKGKKAINITLMDREESLSLFGEINMKKNKAEVLLLIEENSKKMKDLIVEYNESKETMSDNQIDSIKIKISNLFVNTSNKNVYLRNGEMEELETFRVEKNDAIKMINEYALAIEKPIVNGLISNGIVRAEELKLTRGMAQNVISENLIEINGIINDVRVASKIYKDFDITTITDIKDKLEKKLRTNFKLTNKEVSGRWVSFDVEGKLHINDVRALGHDIKGSRSRETYMSFETYYVSISNEEAIEKKSFYISRNYKWDHFKVDDDGFVTNVDFAGRKWTQPSNSRKTMVTRGEVRNKSII